MRRSIALSRAVSLCLALFASSAAIAREESLASPDGRVVVSVSDTDGLRYRVSLDEQPVLVDSRLGLDFNGGLSLGRAAKIGAAARSEHDGAWENSFGQRRVVSDHYRELKLELQETADAPRRLNLIVRAYDNGVALRYEIPDAMEHIDLALAPAGGYAAALTPEPTDRSP